MSLKLRLNLIITALLMLMLLAGAVLMVHNARHNVRAEIESTEKLALYLIDTVISYKSQISKAESNGRPFRLQSLRHMRHIKIEFYDPTGQLRDSNQSPAPAHEVADTAPAWFVEIMDRVSQKWAPTRRAIEFTDHSTGELVITPDPSYEYAEIWRQTADLFVLAGIFFFTVNIVVYWAVGHALRPVDRILGALNELERGNLDARLPAFELYEMARISEKFNHMVETLKQSIRRNHQLSQQLISLQEQERKSLARDLHDELGQSLTAIHADASAILLLGETKCPEVLESAKAVTRLSRHLMEMVGGMLQQLRPGVLDELGLAAALRDLVESWQARQPHISCTLKISDDELEGLREPVTITAYRVLQECLTNISRHAAATAVEIAVGRDGAEARSPALHIAISDNGRGFDPDHVEGFGLAGMRERVEGLGGMFKLDSKAGVGTCVQAVIPLKLEV
ncbi:MAG: HAMP domain-containing protein [Nitrosomonadales bacterium]|nr:MAG: HAMP domain-containing protein [Nitrosomonadales bacterium]